MFAEYVRLPLLNDSENLMKSKEVFTKSHKMLEFLDSAQTT